MQSGDRTLCVIPMYWTIEYGLFCDVYLFMEYMGLVQSSLQHAVRLIAIQLGSDSTVLTGRMEDEQTARLRRHLIRLLAAPFVAF